MKQRVLFVDEATISQHYRDSDYISQTIRNIDCFLRRFNSIEEKLDACDYLIKIFKMDLIAWSQTQFFTLEHPESNYYGIPIQYHLADGTEKIMLPTGSCMLPLDSDIVALPWNENKLVRALRIIKENLFHHQSKIDHDVEYYKQLDLAIVCSGRHSITAGTFYSKGAEPLIADVYDLSELYEHIGVRREGWYNVHTNTTVECHCWVQLTILYYVSRTQYFLRKSIENKSEHYNNPSPQAQA